MCLRVVANPTMNGRIIRTSYQNLLRRGNCRAARKSGQVTADAILTKFDPPHSAHAARNQASLRRSVSADDADGEGGAGGDSVHHAGPVPLVQADPADRKARLARAAY